MIKYGLKIWSSNKGVIDDADRLIKEGVFNFVEILPVPDSDITPYEKLKLPYVIHIPHSGFGFDLGDKSKNDFNLKIINESIEWADRLSAKYLILHTGFGEMKTVLEFLENINDTRIIIENMPKEDTDGRVMVGSSPEDVKKLMGNKFGFCLDFGHGVTLSENYKKDIKEFLKLKPDMFHISDGILNNPIDEHLNIGEGEYDFKFLMDCLSKSDSSMVTLETPRENLKSFDEDIINLNKLKKFL